jgi:hypothetical protein
VLLSLSRLDLFCCALTKLAVNDFRVARFDKCFFQYKFKYGCLSFYNRMYLLALFSVFICCLFLCCKCVLFPVGNLFYVARFLWCTFEIDVTQVHRLFI